MEWEARMQTLALLLAATGLELIWIGVAGTIAVAILGL